MFDADSERRRWAIYEQQQHISHQERKAATGTNA
jgi:hypothetical protein